VRFGVFEFDSLTGELRRRGLKIIHFQEQSSRLLALLLENPGELVSREQLRSHLWPANTFVGFADSINSAIRKLRLALNDSVDNPRFIDTLPRYGYRFIAPVEQIDMAPPTRLTSHHNAVHLVVSPLENRSANASQQYFVDGLTDALMTELLKIPKLTLLRSSVAHYQSAGGMVPPIAQELRADLVTEGNVVCCAEGVRVTVRLWETATGLYVWGASYERKLQKILASQRELAQSIANDIAIKLALKSEATFVCRMSPPATAYEAYLKGRYCFSKRNGEALKKAVQFFQQAIDKEPDYAQAYVGLADCYSLFSWYGLLAPNEAFAKARTAALKAIAINGTLAEAHNSLACAMVGGLNWDWRIAEFEFKKAVELNPYYAFAHQRYAEYLLAVGRPEAAIAELNRGLEIEPLSLSMNATLGRAYRDYREYDEAVEQCVKTVNIDPTFAMGHFLLGLAHIQAGAHDTAVEDELTARFSGGSSLVLGALGCAYATANKTQAALQVLQELLKLSNETYVSPYGIAMIYSGLGERDRALDWLCRAYEQHDFIVGWLRLDPQFDDLRSDARFIELVHQTGLPP
jgi:tetratricopeptide (TPR) repeat protein/DNA-binding winged helix-turn-helix (wHTH) protein